MSSDVEHLAHEVAELRTRVVRLEDEREVAAALHRYGPALDYGDALGWAQCFTVDGVWETMAHPTARQVYLEGPAELAAFGAQHSHAPQSLHKHCVFDSLLNIDGDDAICVSYFARFDAFDDGPGVYAFGRYHDRLQRQSDGRWLIQHRRVEIESLAPRRAVVNPEGGR